jgi:hypothetical protein
MGFKTVQGLDAEVTVALGKMNKETGKPYPKSAEGYYLGSRTVENKKGDSKLHFLQTEEGNLGVWGTTDLDRKLSQVTVGTMTRITSTGTKETKNGDMYTYRVEQDDSNTIDVNLSTEAEEVESENLEADDNYDADAAGESEEENEPLPKSASKQTPADKRAEYQKVLSKGKKK